MSPAGTRHKYQWQYGVDGTEHLGETDTVVTTEVDVEDCEVEPRFFEPCHGIRGPSKALNLDTNAAHRPDQCTIHLIVVIDHQDIH
jgi:hypothetical protein